MIGIKGHSLKPWEYPLVEAEENVVTQNEDVCGKEWGPKRDKEWHKPSFKLPQPLRRPFDSANFMPHSKLLAFLILLFIAGTHWAERSPMLFHCCLFQYLVITLLTLFSPVRSSQLSNVWWMINSVNKGLGPAMRDSFIKFRWTTFHNLCAIVSSQTASLCHAVG